MSGAAIAHGLAGRDDAVAFLGRLTRIDPGALVRLRPAGDAGYTMLWGRLPWGALVTRAVAGAGPGDVTVGAADLLAELAGQGHRLPARRDERWRWPLPPAAGEVVETVAAAELRRLAAAAARTVRAAAVQGVSGRPVGQRALRDALLDHVALVVTESTGSGTDDRIEVSQRLVQAVSRMGFLGPDGSPHRSVQVRSVGRWVGVSAPFGVAWLHKATDLTVRPIAVHTNG